MSVLVDLTPQGTKASNLKNHVQAKHPKEYKEYLKMEDAPKPKKIRLVPLSDDHNDDRDKNLSLIHI